MQKIILYYKFAPIADPEAVRLWQRLLCEKLSLKGRILISKHGINGTLGGHIDDLRTYAKETKLFMPFKGTQFKWSDGTGQDFPRLSIKVRPEIVAFDAANELTVDEQGVVNGGQHLTPQQLHQLVAERGEDVVFFDGRNKHEAAVGKFKNAVVPNVETSRDFKRELDNGVHDNLKNKAVVTYCTGGIRCEILTAMMKNRGFNEVYQLDGGIVKYGQTYKDKGLWEGKLYVFDDRLVTQFSDGSSDIGQCEHCKGVTSQFWNCSNQQCNRLVLLCNACIDKAVCEACR